MTADGTAGDYTDIVLFLATAGVAVPILHLLVPAAPSFLAAAGE